jgi:hypothetical protein
LKIVIKRASRGETFLANVPSVHRRIMVQVGLGKTKQNKTTKQSKAK